MSQTISLEKMVEAGAHFGHQMRRWNPQMRDYLHSVKDGVFVFDLVKTGELLEEALNVLTDASKNGKTILIVGTKKQVKEATKALAKETGIFSVTERWLGGTFTNFGQIKRSVTKLTDTKAKLASGGYADFTKKERLLIARDVEKLERMFGGLVGMNKLPDVMLVIDTHREQSAVTEARRMKIPTIGVVDSNGDASDVDYPIPMNDDASTALEYVLGLFEGAILEGQGRTKTVVEAPKTAIKKEKKEKVAKEVITEEKTEVVEEKKATKKKAAKKVAAK
jgi:small subunit ribosomal protein S2